VTTTVFGMPRPKHWSRRFALFGPAPIKDENSETSSDEPLLPIALRATG
jgi:hypothetical protein